MKTRLFSFCLTAIAVLMLLSLTPAWGASGRTLKFNLSEPAMLGPTALAPGEYSAHILDTISDSPVLILEPLSGGSRVMIQVKRSGAQDSDENPHVTLTRHEGTLQLTDFQFSGDSFAYEVLSR